MVGMATEGHVEADQRCAVEKEDGEKGRRINPY